MRQRNGYPQLAAGRQRRRSSVGMSSTADQRAAMGQSTSGSRANRVIAARLGAGEAYPHPGARGMVLSALSTRSGVIGMRDMRTPVARATALATAAAGGTIATSPTPRTP
jgi:hypothetical protein